MSIRTSLLPLCIICSRATCVAMRIIRVINIKIITSVGKAVGAGVLQVSDTNPWPWFTLLAVKQQGCLQALQILLSRYGEAIRLIYKNCK